MSNFRGNHTQKYLDGIRTRCTSYVPVSLWLRKRNVYGLEFQNNVRKHKRLQDGLIFENEMRKRKGYGLILKNVIRYEISFKNENTGTKCLTR